MNATKNLLVLAFVIVAMCATSSVGADFNFGEPVRVGAGLISSDDIDCFSSDGLEMYIDRYLGGDDIDLHVLKRATVDDDWGPPVSLGPAVNSSQEDWLASVSTDGLTLYFQSNRTGGYGATDLYVTTRASRSAPWGATVNMGPTINGSAIDANVWISPDGLELYFMSTRSGGYGGFDFYVSRRATTNDPWGDPVNLGAVVNSAYNEDGTGLSPDGLLLLFDDNASPRPGGYGGGDMWMSRRASLADPWQTPVNLGPKVNGPGLEFLPRISLDGRTLYFWSSGSSTRPADVYQAPIVPMVDFNGDGFVEIEDLVMLIESWGAADSLCDVGAMPWGDGIVDEADLKVLMSYWGQEAYDPALIAHWRLDEAEGTAAIDSIGVYEGTLVGDPVWRPTAGKLGGALELDGVDDCVTTKLVPGLLESPLSVFAWIRGGAPEQVVISQKDGANWLGADPASGSLETGLRGTSRNGCTLCSETIITDGDWHRIGLVWDGTNRSLYVDDVVVAEDTQTGGFEHSSWGLNLGCGANYSPATFWKGLIDDVRIYDRAVTP